jgi:CRP-like cAMP-binding protein
MQKALDEKLRRESLMESIDLFADCLNKHNKMSLAESAQQHEYEDGDMICSHGDMIHSLFIVDDGEVAVSGVEDVITTGHVLAQACFINNQPLQHDYVAKGATSCLMISADELMPFRDRITKHWALLRKRSLKLRRGSTTSQ